MTTIPQRLREIVRSGPFDERRSAISKLADEIAAELEAPAADAVPVVAWWVRAGQHMGSLMWLPGYPTQMHSEDALMLRSVHIATVAALQARINALEARQWFLADETDETRHYAWVDAQEAYEKAAGCLRGHLEWRDRVRAAVRVLMDCKPQPDSSKEAP